MTLPTTETITPPHIVRTRRGNVGILVQKRGALDHRVQPLDSVEPFWCTENGYKPIPEEDKIVLYGNPQNLRKLERPCLAFEKLTGALWLVLDNPDDHCLCLDGKDRRSAGQFWVFAAPDLECAPRGFRIEINQNTLKLF